MKFVKKNESEHLASQSRCWIIHSECVSCFNSDCFFDKKTKSQEKEHVLLPLLHHPEQQEFLKWCEQRMTFLSVETEGYL